MSDDEPVDVDEQRVIAQEASPITKAEAEQNRAATEFNRSKDGQLAMRVKVYSPFRGYYDGRAFSISAVNATGPFDVLPRHHNFISLLSPCELVVRTVDKEERKISISGGLMHVKADRAIVFLDI
jgi:hypothetical protein